jgi:hypothetical protein
MEMRVISMKKKRVKMKGMALTLKKIKRKIPTLVKMLTSVCPMK